MIQYLHNHLPTTTLSNDIMPYEHIEKSKPNLSHLHVWGCQCFVHISEELHTKGGPCCFEAIFVGYEENHIGWHVCDLSGKYHFLHDVIFNKSLPGHLGTSHSVIPDLPADTDTIISHPQWTVCQTPAGQAYNDLAQCKE